ncbi:MAG: HU family DNA-binding protein [Thermomicrobiales bacterium]
MAAALARQLCQSPKGKGRVHKNEFIRQVAKEAGLPQTMVSQVLSAAVRVVARSLIAGQKVVWTGFGTFEMRQRSERRGINPQTRERITIDATNTPGFTASSAFKERVLNADEGATDDDDE